MLMLAGRSDEGNLVGRMREPGVKVAVGAKVSGAQWRGMGWVIRRTLL